MFSEDQQSEELSQLNKNICKNTNSSTPLTSPLESSNGQATREFPAELNKFNWGAFFLSWIWGIGHGVWIALLIFLFNFFPMIASLIGLLITSIVGEGIGSIVTSILTIVSLVIIFGFLIWLGRNGNRLAWKAGRVKDIESYKKAEKTWALVGFLLFLFFGMVIIVALFSGIYAGSRQFTEIESHDKAVANRIKNELYNKEHITSEAIVYCGESGQMECGTYSFKQATEKLNFWVTGNDNCKNGSGLEGGGKLILSKNEYLILPYDARCENPIPGQEERN